MRDSIVEDAFKQACWARDHAYTPYSRFKVGASLIVKNNTKIITGCNVENISYGLSICAERNAIFNAVQSLGPIEIVFLLLVVDQDTPVSPCGACLQVISEFSQPKTIIHLCNLKGVQKSLKLIDLLPFPFIDFHSSE